MRMVDYYLALREQVIEFDERQLKRYGTIVRKMSSIELVSYSVGYYGGVDGECFNAIRKLALEGLIEF